MGRGSRSCDHYLSSHVRNGTYALGAYLLLLMLLMFSLILALQ